MLPTHQNIQKLRERLGLKAHEVAKGVGVSRGYYSQLESGARRLRDEHVQKIAEFMGVHPSEFYGISPPTPDAGDTVRVSAYEVKLPAGIAEAFEAALADLNEEGFQDIAECIALYRATPPERRQETYDIVRSIFRLVLKDVDTQAGT